MQIDPRPGFRPCRPGASPPWPRPQRRPSALARSPEYLMPPSAITPMPALSADFPRRRGWPSAVACRQPATMRVVQIEPGPDADLDGIPRRHRSAPWCHPRSPRLPARMRTELESFLARSTASSTRWEWPCAVSDRPAGRRRHRIRRFGAHRSRHRRRWWRRRPAAGPARPWWRGD